MTGCPRVAGSACLGAVRHEALRGGGRRGLSIEIEAQITGNVWKIETKVGDEVEEDDVLIIIESMKMEIPVESPEDGRVLEIKVAEGQAIEEGDVLVVLEG